MTKTKRCPFSIIGHRFSSILPAHIDRIVKRFAGF
ncbi:hypothetical protein B23_3702 [Geobacillus thermoleovorans B23]|nr:hypothetical protein B23_3702 [Geobacillus thermoleovorans B23]